MKSWTHKLEYLVDMLVPVALIVLVVIIAVELFWPGIAEGYSVLVQAADWTVLAVFVLDVFFKFRRAKNIPKFLRESWLDIIAIFPFFLVFRLFEGILGLIGLSETVARSQQVLHASVEVEKEAELALKEGSRFAEEISKTARAESLTRFLNPLVRSTRLFILGDPHIRHDIKEEKDMIEQAEKKAGRRLKRAEKKAVRILVKPKHVLKASVFYEKPGLVHRHLNPSGRIEQKAAGHGKGRHFY